MNGWFFNGRLAGTYTRAAGFYPFYAKRFTPSPAFPNEVPAIDGVWQIGGVRSNKGEAARRRSSWVGTASCGGAAARGDDHNSLEIVLMFGGTEI